MPEDKFRGLERHITRAISTIVKHMTDPETPPQVQLRACQVYLDLSMKYLRTAQLEESIHALEQHLADNPGMPFLGATMAENGLDELDDEDSEEL